MMCNNYVIKGLTHFFTPFKIKLFQIIMVFIHRRCHLTEFGFTLAAFDIMFINMSRRYPACNSGRAALSFNGFCESLIAIGHKKFSLTMRLEPVQILLTVLKHCEQHLRWPAGKTVDVSQPQRKQMLPSRLSQRNFSSCFVLSTSHLTKENHLWINCHYVYVLLTVGKRQSVWLP